MTERSHAASAGLRGSNIEIMVQRRSKTHDEDGLADNTLDERDVTNMEKGIKVSATYWMEIGSMESKQRLMQKRLE